MTKLDCNVVNCSYNADNCCRRTDIQVEGTQAKTSSETCCGSFAPKGSGCQSCHTTDVKKKIQPSAVKRVSANSTRIMPVMRDTLVFPADMQTAAGRQSAAVLYAAADRGIWAADCRPASERRKGMEQLTDYSINFPHLHIYLHHVGKKYHDRKFFGGILWNCDCNRNVSRTWNRLLDGKTDEARKRILILTWHSLPLSVLSLGRGFIM